jgi:hypothetical protein
MIIACTTIEYHELTHILHQNIVTSILWMVNGEWWIVLTSVTIKFWGIFTNFRQLNQDFIDSFAIHIDNFKL